MTKSKNKFVYYGNIAWIYTKYQLLTKSMLLFIIFPIFKRILKSLLEATGRISISSGDYFNFLFSPQGFALLILSLLMLALLIGLDIHAFIIMSALIKENRIKFKAGHLLVIALKSLKSLFKPSGILVMLYIAMIIPLVGIGLSISIMENFKIPNFITDVIFNNSLYFTIYSFVIIFLTLITIVYIFFFHYLIIEDRNIEDSLKMSFRLMKKHWKEFIKRFFIRTGMVYVIVILTIILASYFLLFFSQKIETVFFRRLSALFISISTAEIFSCLLMLTAPLICFRLTDLFYLFNKNDGNDVLLKQSIKAEDIGDAVFKKVKLRTKFYISLTLIILIIFNLFISVVLSMFFEDIFKPHREIAIVAHRGGGDLAAENSILGMEDAAKHGAKWSEIDVQRTKDGHYIIHHDLTFSRVAKDRRPAKDLSLNQIKKLKIFDLFDPSRPSQPVATLEEYLEAAKGKIGLFIELKGSTADEKMVDDVVKMVKEKSMENEIAILSLDYNLIQYTEKKYPEISTGYLYFFSIGEIQNIHCDILIMEEQEATEEKVDAIHRMGKKAIVWTVNTEESIKKFVSSNVDGIITDYILNVKERIKIRDNRSDIQIIIESILDLR